MAAYRQLSSRPTKQELEAKHIIISKLHVTVVVISHLCCETMQRHLHKLDELYLGAGHL